jgi:hypothetical protein
MLLWSKKKTFKEICKLNTALKGKKKDILFYAVEHTNHFEPELEHKKQLFFHKEEIRL